MTAKSAVFVKTGSRWRLLLSELIVVVGDDDDDDGGGGGGGIEAHGCVRYWAMTPGHK
jgi:hypothetical protein